MINNFLMDIERRLKLFAGHLRENIHMSKSLKSVKSVLCTITDIRNIVHKRIITSI